MTAISDRSGEPFADPEAPPPRGGLARVRAALPHGGSLPDAEWDQRHRVILLLLWSMIVFVPVYAVLEPHHAGAISFVPEYAALLAFSGLGMWGISHKWKSLSASLGLMTAVATLVEISGGLTDLHFAFFVVVVFLTLYEDWTVFLVSVAFVLIHHGIMGEVDPRAVFNEPYQFNHPWKWAGIHAGFMALAGVAGIIAWKFNEGVRDQMRRTQRELERLGLTDPLTSLGNRRRLMADLAEAFADDRAAVLVIFDLDGFKEYNDRFGHPAGDSLLVRLTTKLRHALGAAEAAYRLGGDEFCVLSRAPSGGRQGCVAAWTACFEETGDGFHITASSGAAELPAEAADGSAALRLCDRRMYAAKHGRRTTAARQTRDVLLAALAARHAELGNHLDGVAVAAEQVAEAMGLSRSEVQELTYAAELHDVGKVAIPAEILAKAGPLDNEEWEFMRRHTIIGERILGVAPSMRSVARIVRATHERFDGTGYPDRTAGEEIPLGARIVAVCDAYSAMTAGRPYRSTSTHRQALRELRRCAGAQFDPEVVRHFCELFADEPPHPRRKERPLTTAATVRPVS